MAEKAKYQDREFCTEVGSWNESDWFVPTTRPRWEPERDNTLLEDLWQYPEPEATVCVVEVEAPSLEAQFKQHADKWERETSHLSSPTQMIAHPSYQAIIRMGPNVVPMLIRDMEETGRTWFWALATLTKENPVDPRDAGKVKRMVDSWVKWAKKRGRI